MANNPEAQAILKAVGLTPGFAMETENDGGYKVIRLAIPDRNIKRATAKASPRAHGVQLHNLITRLRRIGWTRELFDQIQVVERKYRSEGREDELPAVYEQLLLVSLGVNHTPIEETPPADVPGQRGKRHGKNITGSGKVKATAASAIPDLPSSSDAPVEYLENVGPMRAERISPERAIDLIIRMAPYQRPLRKDKVKDYAAAMLRGEWVLNPADPICIDTNNLTCNGHHRLQAVIESETTQEFFVARDVEPTSYRIFDRGTKRTHGDGLHGAGEVNVNNLAGVAKLAHLWFNLDQDQWKRTTEVTDSQISAILESHPGLRESVRLGRISGIKVSPTGSMFVHYLISRKMGGDSRLVTKWYQDMGQMALVPGTPGHALGLYLLRSSPAAARRTDLASRSKRELDMYLLMQAWNNTCLGKTQKTISYKPDFVIADPLTPGKDHGFPALD